MVFQQYIRLVPRITDSGEVKAFPVRTDTVFETSGAARRACRRGAPAKRNWRRPGAPHCHTPTTTPRLVREVQQTESMDLLTGFSSGAIWRNLSKDPSILTDELRGPAAAWISMVRVGAEQTAGAPKALQNKQTGRRPKRSRHGRWGNKQTKQNVERTPKRTNP